MAGQASMSVAPNNGDKTHTGGPNTQPSSGREGVPMIRPIRLYVSNDRVAILPDGAQTPADMVRASQSQAVRFEGPTTGQINDVIGMLKKYAESWGIAGDGMYWDPRLVLNIDADGAQRVCWTDTWAAARAWMREKLSTLPLEVEVDAAGNQWATLEGASERCVLIGGHIDSGAWMPSSPRPCASVRAVRSHRARRLDRSGSSARITGQCS